MKNRLYASFLIAASVAVLLATAARAADRATSTLAFSDATRPGTLRINVNHGDLRIRGSDRSDIAVTSSAQSTTSQPRADGLRVLTAASSFTLREKGNVAVLDYGTDSRTPGADFEIAVPRATSVVISNMWGGDVRVADVTGDVEINTLNGEVVLEQLGGAALVDTRNGKIVASFHRLPADKPVSFTSMNGAITVHVPHDATANVRLRSQNGAILTDFDEKSLVTALESSADARPRRPTRKMNESAADTEIREAVRTTAKEVAQATREAVTVAREAVRVALDEWNAKGGDVPPLPPLPPLPPMTGGKVISGTLNGGGPEIAITTMNGDVVLRKR